MIITHFENSLGIFGWSISAVYLFCRDKNERDQILDRQIWSYTSRTLELNFVHTRIFESACTSINKKFNDVSFQLNTRLTAVNSVLAQSY